MEVGTCWRSDWVSLETAKRRPARIEHIFEVTEKITLFLKMSRPFSQVLTSSYGLLMLICVR